VERRGSRLEASGVRQRWEHCLAAQDLSGFAARKLVTIPFSVNYTMGVKTFFNVFNVFLIFQTFFYLKKRWQSSERQAGSSRLTRSTFKVTATKFNRFIKNRIL